MFKVGDKIVYPMQGAGSIVAIEEKEFSGELQKYYVIFITHCKLKILIPVNQVNCSHLRKINDEETLNIVLQKVHKCQLSLSGFPSLKERNEFLNSKIRSGSMMENAEVVSVLTEINNTKRLNSTEKHLLDKAKRLLIGEISLIKDIPEKQAALLVNDVIN